MPESWKETNINAGALIAFVVGVATIATTVVSIQWWIDDRINIRVTPLEVELREFKVEMRSALNSSDASRNRQYGQILSKFDELLEARQ
jgi:hypothetical protein